MILGVSIPSQLVRFVRATLAQDTAPRPFDLMCIWEAALGICHRINTAIIGAYAVSYTCAFMTILLYVLEVIMLTMFVHIVRTRNKGLSRTKLMFANYTLAHSSKMRIYSVSRCFIVAALLKLRTQAILDTRVTLIVTVIIILLVILFHKYLFCCKFDENAGYANNVYDVCPARSPQL